MANGLQFSGLAQTPAPAGAPAPFVSTGNVFGDLINQQRRNQGLPPLPPQGTPGAPPAPGPRIPPTGLAGSESALLRALMGSFGTLTGAGETARGDITGGTAGAIDQLTQAGQTIGGQFQQGQDLLTGAGTDILSQLRGGQDILTGAGTTINQQIQQGVDPAQQFIGAGADAQQLIAALSGVGGQEAFDQALIDSPAQQFLREQGNQAVLRGASATGGLGGGEVQKELTRFGQGLASTRIQDQINNLATLTDQGLRGAGIVGQLRGTQAGLTGDIGRTGAGLTETGAGITSDLSRTGADLTGRQAGITSDLGRTGADIIAQGGFNLADIAGSTGRDISDAILNTGQLQSAGRTVAGRDIATSIGDTTSALADLINQQGAGVSDLTGGAAQSIIDLLSGAGEAEGLSQEQLAELLAKISAGQVGGVAGLPGIPGIQQEEGILQDLGAAASGAGTAFAAFSDARLKENVWWLGTLDSGHEFYSWIWNEKGKAIVGDQPSFGVIAQEAQIIDPDSVKVGEHGYLTVDYSRIH